MKKAPLLAAGCPARIRHGEGPRREHGVRCWTTQQRPRPGRWGSGLCSGWCETGWGRSRSWRSAGRPGPRCARAPVVRAAEGGGQHRVSPRPASPTSYGPLPASYPPGPHNPEPPSASRQHISYAIAHCLVSVCGVALSRACVQRVHAAYGRERFPSPRRPGQLVGGLHVRVLVAVPGSGPDHRAGSRLARWRTRGRGETCEVDRTARSLAITHQNFGTTPTGAVPSRRRSDHA